MTRSFSSVLLHLRRTFLPSRSKCFQKFSSHIACSIKSNRRETNRMGSSLLTRKSPRFEQSRPLITGTTKMTSLIASCPSTLPSLGRRFISSTSRPHQKFDFRNVCSITQEDKLDVRDENATLSRLSHSATVLRPYTSRSSRRPLRGRDFCSSNVKPFQMFKPKFAEAIETDDELTNRLKAFSQSYKVRVSEHIDAIHLPQLDKSSSPVEIDVDDVIAPNIIFVRRRVHEPLLQTIRTIRRVAVIGNPGTGKSAFQFYYLARILNPELYGPLPPDHRGSTDPPSVILRQKGANQTEIYDLVSTKAAVVDFDGNRLIRNLLDRSKAIYWFEPGNDICPPCIECATVRSSMTTTSTEEIRIKEYVKKGATELYFPVWTLKELLDINSYLLEQRILPDYLKDLFSPALVEARYKEFGGIIRFCLPSSEDVVAKARGRRIQEIQSANPKLMIGFEWLQNTRVSAFIALMKVDMKINPFRRFTIDFVNEDVAKRLEDKFMQVDVADKIWTLKRNDETGYLDTICPYLFEDVVIDLFLRGVRWRFRECNSNEWQPASFSTSKLKRRVEGSIPGYDKMEVGTLYIPVKSNFAFADIIWKEEDGSISCANMTRVEKERNVKGLKAFADALNLPPECSVNLYIVPKPKRAASLKVAIDPKLNAGVSVELAVYVLQTPSDYGTGNEDIW